MSENARLELRTGVRCASEPPPAHASPVCAPDPLAVGHAVRARVARAAAAARIRGDGERLADLERRIAVFHEFVADPRGAVMRQGPDIADDVDVDGADSSLTSGARRRECMHCGATLDEMARRTVRCRRGCGCDPAGLPGARRGCCREAGCFVEAKRASDALEGLIQLHFADAEINEALANALLHGDTDRYAEIASRLPDVPGHLARFFAPRP